jgi:hypothetical protein
MKFANDDDEDDTDALDDVLRDVLRDGESLSVPLEFRDSRRHQEDAALRRELYDQPAACRNNSFLLPTR